MSERFRCSVAALAEPLAGSAATDGAFLLIEYAAPWGRRALAESRLPEPVREGLAGAAEQAGVRVQLIRRPGRTRNPDGFRVFAAYADPVAPWVETAVLDRPEDLLLLDLPGLGAGRTTGLEPHGDELFLVCTNGRRDLCCAELGRTVVSALAEAHPAETWETTHLGGHRYAAAMLVLPAGLAYGRVTGDDAVRIAGLAKDGRLDPRHLRGRTAYPGAVQAAEVALRKRVRDDRVDGLELVDVTGNGELCTVRFRHETGVHELVVETVVGPPVRQSCADDRTKPTVSHLVR